MKNYLCSKTHTLISQTSQTLLEDIVDAISKETGETVKKCLCLADEQTGQCYISSCSYQIC